MCVCLQGTHSKPGIALNYIYGKEETEETILKRMKSARNAAKPIMYNAHAQSERLSKRR